MDLLGAVGFLPLAGTTLADAINWWGEPQAWREDFTAVLTLKSGKRPHKQHLSEVQFDDDER